jgi:AMP-polyphosphate phosphotransferase
MLDQIDLDRSISKREYKARLPELQSQLYYMEQALLEARIPTLIILEGWAGTFKVDTLSVLLRRLDPRGLRVHAITPPRTYEMQYPWLHRFWLKIPSYGQMAIFDRSWYRQVLQEHAQEQHSSQHWHDLCDDIIAFERQLANDGAVILKFWLHISKKEQKRRLRKLQSDAVTAWQVTDADLRQNQHYKKFGAAVEDLMARTNTPYAPWIVLPATDKRYEHVTAFETILGWLQTRLGQPSFQIMPVTTTATEAFEQDDMSFRSSLVASDDNGALQRPALPDLDLEVLQEQPPPGEPTPAPIPQPAPGILQRVDLSKKIDEKKYERKLAQLQAKLHLLGFQVYQQKRPVVLVFEGWDAAGKGGVIQRITEKIDPRSYIVHSISAPSGDDKVRHYLYRFWRRLPPCGAIAIFDRSWYGRVMVERIEGFARPDEWQRAYIEINEFERQLTDFGTIVCKFWLHISPEEQLRRFEERRNIPYKAWKLTDEDWRNREKWPQYEQAVDEMLLRTSIPAAPWTIVEADDKRFARIKTLRTLVKRLEQELGKVKL